MKMTLIKTDGTRTEVIADTATEVEKIIQAGFLDVVDLRDGRVMFVDDDGQAKNSPINHQATKLYHSICRAGTTYEIKGDCGLKKLACPLTGIRGRAGTSGRRQGRLGELAAQFTARGAVHPMQAMLNFATAIVTARLTRAIVAMGLDPCFGFLHDGRKPGRLSLVWDCVEPLRPKLVRAVFEYAAAHEFERQAFLVFVHKITAERTVRLAAPLAKEIVEIAVRAVSVRECVKAVNWLVNVIK